ncbi:hypothetical protein E1A91_A02G064200v1 [Gossypium mustelinum]|uniref:BCNT-C domain-containing protein n=1 Tax=Gossypium mustelinum TaxID=34275 RepID=A0A5D3A472_GOSMU|nr:hypothetical protein E1A91_A02G064200v1 [Gossypium mustelinum]
MATTSNCPDDSGNVNGKEGTLNESVKENAMALNSELQRENTEAKSRVEAMWEQMNKGIPKDALRQFSSNKASATNKTSHKASNNWMKYLQMRPAVPAGDTMQERWTEAKAPSATKETETLNKDKAVKEATVVQNNVSDEAKKLAAAALSAVKDAAAAAAAASNRGKIEITEVRDFAGQEIEIKKRIHADSKEAAEKAKAYAPSAVDAVLEQIKKKPKLSVLDKTKKDWGEFKEENKGMEDELDAYKKSSNQYLDKVSFLQRTDYREFERERDARLALQARRRPEMREDP